MKSQANHILIVEDNPEDYDVFKYALEQVRVSVDVTRINCGGTALEYLCSASPKVESSTDKPVDLIILDINLPRVSGLKLLKELRKTSRWLGIPILMLTTSPEPKDIREAYESGANSFLVKPVALDHFIDLLDTMCRYWLLYSQTYTPAAGQGTNFLTNK